MIYPPTSLRLAACVLFFSLLPTNHLAARSEPDTALETTLASRLLVVGFVGGYIGHTNAIHQEVQLATHLREEYPSDLAVEVFENHSGPLAHERILQLLDTDHDGSLSADEKHKARIVLYGHSWGASEAVTTARALQSDGVPVLLTIQIDSVSKHGETTV